MPYKDQLLRMQRVDENTWSQNTMLPVSFATLVVPPSSEHNLFHLRMYISETYICFVRSLQFMIVYTIFEILCCSGVQSLIFARAMPW